MTTMETIQGWLNNFKADTKRLGPTDVMLQVAMLHVGDPEKLDPEDYTKDQQLFVNREVHRILSEQNLIPKVRRALRDDLNREGEDDQYGIHVQKAWGREALEHFFVPNPTWI